MEAKIIPLKCPNCGNADNTNSGNLYFGFEFKCTYCGTTSVLVINNQLYTPLPGERVCRICGRVAEKTARFCQCGKSLIRKCVNPRCLKEFPAHHEICDSCGWPQSIDPYSQESAALKNEFALRELSDPDPTVRFEAYLRIRDSLANSIDVEKTIDVINKVLALGPDSITLLEYLALKSNLSEIRQSSWEALGRIANVNMRYPPKGLAQAIANIYIHSKDDKILKQAGELIVPLGKDCVPLLVKAMDEFPVYSTREQVSQLIIKIGYPALNELKEIIFESKCSPEVGEWLTSAIKKISQNKH